MLTLSHIEQVLSFASQARIGLVGDLFLDRYWDIAPSLDEPSVETGLTAYQVTGVRHYPGALGTVLNNLVALGVGAIHPVTVLGDDGEGFELRRILSAIPTVDSTHLVTDPTRRTPTYTKPMYGNRELHRLDIKNRSPLGVEIEDRLVRALMELPRYVDAVIVLDQVSERNCGVVTDRVRDVISQLPQTRSVFFVLADSRERIGEFRNVVVKPNEQECWNAVRRSQSPVTAFPTEHFELQALVQAPVLLTQGVKGMSLVEGPGMVQHIPAYPVTGPIDICGAGDSVSAALTLARVAGLNLPEAAAFGNLVASITIQQIGTTGTATPDQVRARFAEHPAPWANIGDAPTELMG
ncbi:MAG: bifunctional heptose 7-phosphate kinase/heptose 1-phosphate adenyltransferase [Fimbriiglobus sp.]